MSRDRKSIRLKGWDYSSQGIYFITICTLSRIEFFGQIKDHNIVLSEIGEIASQFWMDIPNHFPNVRIDDFVIMPDHVHGIIFLKSSETKHSASQFSMPLKGSLSVIINQYKSSVTRWCNKNGYSTFKWQSRFYDHIILNEDRLDLFRTYIRTNPLNWRNHIVNYKE
jgi:putative transposase